MKLEKVNNVVWYKESKPGREPVKFVAKKIGPKNIHITIFADPILKKHKDLKDALFKHEVREAMLWCRGKTNAHTIARRNEPNLTEHIGGVSGFWREIDRREKLEGNWRKSKRNIWGIPKF